MKDIILEEQRVIRDLLLDSNCELPATARQFGLRMALADFVAEEIMETLA